MIARRLEVFNFCQHRRREIEFGPGLTAFIGPNGSGKSNLLIAMKYALTGVIETSGAKLDNICQLADPSERSMVSFTLSHDNVDATIRRYLRPDRESELVLPGEPPIRGDRKIAPRLLEFLGVDNRVINEIIIVGQGNIFGFLSKTASKRSETFGKIFGTDVAEDTWKVISKFLRELPRETNPTDIGEATSQVMQLELIESQLCESIGDATEEELQESIRSYEAEMQQSQQLSSLRDQHQQLQTQLETVNRTIAGLEQGIAENEANVEVLQSAADGNREAVESAKATLANLESIRAINTRKEELRRRIAGYQQQEEAEPPQPEHAYDGDLERQQQLITSLATVIRSYELLLEACDPTNECPECPTCHTPEAELGEQLAEARSQLPAARLNLSNLQRIYAANQAHKQRLETFASEKQRYREMREQAEQDLAGLETTAAMPTESPEQLQMVVQEHQQYIDAIEEYRKVVNDGKVQLGRLQGQVDQIIQRSTDVANQIGAITYSPSGVDPAARLNYLRPELQRVQQVSQELTQVRSDLNAKRATLESARAIQARITMVDRFLDQMMPVRDLLHREAAPRFVAQRNLQRIESRVNENLEMFDAEFRVVAHEGLSFIARFADGREQPADRLSGGQKVVLALSFCLAVNFMYSDLGFVALDEPTAYLDEHHIAGFVPVLNRLRTYASSSGLQCLMVTHEQSLAPLFDAVVQL